ncbi:MAG TPA: hypothetical protein VGW98_10295 [Solirubrobacteraceae bacterium]|jgi:hypothetical protein|nr:hypothetical protein [Solirubrobacteraceae bacterium]
MTPSRRTAIARTGGTLLATVAAALALLALLAPAAGASVANTLGFDLQVGAGVLTGNPDSVETCTVFAECRPGQPSTLPGGFANAIAVAVAPSGNIYVTDAYRVVANNRVEELKPNGQFVLMFGWDVNKTKVKANAPQSERNVCTAAEVNGGAECGAGEAGTGLPGQLDNPSAVAVDPANGHVYVANLAFYRRVEEFTENGQFILMIGREVNQTLSKRPGATPDEKNVCTAVQIETEGMTCQAGQEKATMSEHDAFYACSECGNVLAVGGPKDLLYVADQGRVAEIGATGKWEGQLPLNENSSPAFPANNVVTALAVDGGGDVYVTEAVTSIVTNPGSPQGVYELSPTGAELGAFDTSSYRVETFALDPFGRMAVIEATEVSGRPPSPPRGVLLDLATNKPLSEFAPHGGMNPLATGLAFNPSGELYVADAQNSDVELYHLLQTAEVITEREPPCTRRPLGRGAFELSLQGSIDPKGIVGTEGWFAYGPTAALGSTTARQPFATVTGALPLDATVTGLSPNTTYYYRGEASDASASGAGETLSCKTRAVPPAVEGAPEAFPSAATYASAVLLATVDPEGANTTYRFQYAPYDPAGCPTLDACPARRETEPLQSSENAVLTDEQSLGELQPSTTYLYRLIASNAFEYKGEAEGGETKGQEGTFTTAHLPSLAATTLPASGVAATGATVAGLVNPGGFPATYTFELGLDEGAATHYGVVFSGPAGHGAAPVQETLGLAGLQPGTTYSYRIAIHSGYGTAYGAGETFTTSGLPDVLTQPAVLAQLPIPPLAFPLEPKPGKPAAAKCRRGFKLDKHHRCVKAKKAKKARRHGKGARRNKK